MKILYIHDKENWSIHNVGKLWLDWQTKVEVVYKHFEQTDINDFKNYDYVWVGHSGLCSKWNYDLNKTIITIHDPVELYTEISNWKECKLSLEQIEFFKQVKYLICTSDELKLRLDEVGINTYLINTASELPFINEANIKLDNCSIVSVYNEHTRKNSPLLLQIQRYCEDVLKLKFITKVGKDKILTTEEYIDYLDEFGIYLCTSWQEGGPLTAMDAMNRGLVVVTTPVGQIQTIISNNLDGYLCNTFEEFIEIIENLKRNPEKLLELRRNALKKISKVRNLSIIQEQSRIFLETLGI